MIWIRGIIIPVIIIMKYSNVQSSTCFNHTIDVTMIDNRSFIFTSSYKLMTDDPKLIILKGNYITNGNHTICMVYSSKFLDEDEQIHELSENILTDDRLTFELIDLTSQQTIHHTDYSIMELYCAGNNALFNNENGTFDAMLYFIKNPHSQGNIYQFTNKLNVLKMIKILGG
jgi:hypothetical protein